MKKFMYLSVALICCAVMGMSLTSCGDDEPFISSDFDKTELTAPMFLFEQPTGDFVTSLKNGFSFWSFTDGKAAYGSINYVKENNQPRAILKCTELYNSWSLEGGKLKLGNINHNIKKVTALGVKAFTIDLTIYIPSNLAINGNTAESVLNELDLNKTKLWQGLEKAKAEGPVYVDEL
jgi:hypothetical protein